MRIWLALGLLMLSGSNASASEEDLMKSGMTALAKVILTVPGTEVSNCEATLGILGVVVCNLKYSGLEQTKVGISDKLKAGKFKINTPWAVGDFQGIPCIQIEVQKERENGRSTVLVLHVKYPHEGPTTSAILVFMSLGPPTAEQQKSLEKKE